MLCAAFYAALWKQCVANEIGFLLLINALIDEVDFR
jgi:hypothetical protein